MELETKACIHGMEVAETKRLKHYSNKQKILLVGEGDFSFSLSLARAFGSATNLTATTLDTRGKNQNILLTYIHMLISLPCVM